MAHSLAPIPLRQTLLLFGIPGILLFAGVEYGIPPVLSWGVPLIAFWGFIWVPITFLLPLALWLHRREKTGLSFGGRFRFRRVTRQDVAWIAVGVFVALFFDFAIGGPISEWLAEKPLFRPPDHIPALLDPTEPLSIGTFMGVKLAGNWVVLFAFVPIHIYAMFSEECLWATGSGLDFALMARCCWLSLDGALLRSYRFFISPRCSAKVGLRGLWGQTSPCCPKR